MKKFLIPLLTVIFFAPAALADMLMIENPWSRATPGQSKAGAAFLNIVNHGEKDTLIGAKADVSKFVELHTHLHEDGIMKMREVKSIEIPAQGTAEMKPGGFHIMLIGLHAPLKAGNSFPLTLIFEKGGEKTIDVAIKKIGHTGHEDHHMKKEMKKDHDHGHSHEHDHKHH